MGVSHTLVQRKVAATFLERWPLSPAFLVLASVLLVLECAKALQWEPLVVPVQHVMVSILILYTTIHIHSDVHILMPYFFSQQ